MIQIAQIIMGLIQLLLGRKLFWLMVGLSGFLGGLIIVTTNFEWPAWQKLLVGLGVGLVFSLLTVWLQKPMAAAVAFLAFGITALIIVRLLGIGNTHPLYWIFFVIGGFIGAGLVFATYEWALIIGTSLLGAASVSNGITSLLDVKQSVLLGSILFLFLLVAGINTQAKSLRDKKS